MKVIYKRNHFEIQFESLMKMYVVYNTLSEDYSVWFDGEECLKMMNDDQLFDEFAENNTNKPKQFDVNLCDENNNLKEHYIVFAKDLKSAKQKAAELFAESEDMSIRTAIISFA